MHKSLRQHRRARNTVINVSILIAVFAFFIHSLPLLLLSIVILNFFGFYWVVVDKQKAKQQSTFRLPESTFILLSLCGGALGTFLGMRIYRHKTQHTSLFWGIFLLAIVNILLYFYGITYFDQFSWFAH